MLNTSLRCAARGGTSLPHRPAPSMASFTSRAHQRRHSSSKPPVPPNDGSHTLPTDVKQVAARADAKTESRKPATERLSRKKAAAKAEAIEAQDNWTASFPSVPSLTHLNQKDVSIARFYASYRPISITGPGPKEAPLKDVEKIFQPKPARSKGKGPTEVIYTLSSALENLNEQIETRQQTPQEDVASSQKELFRVVDGSGNHFKVVSTKEVLNPFRPFQPPPAPTVPTQAQLDAFDRYTTSTEDANEEALATQLEAQVLSQDPESAAARGRRDRAKLEALLTPQQHAQTAQIVLNTASLRERFNFFTPSAAVQEPSSTSTRVGGRKRRGYGVPVKKPSDVVHQMISVKRQRKLKMKKHKYKKLMRKTRNLRRRQDKL